MRNRTAAAFGMLAAVLVACIAHAAVGAQALTVLPTTIEMLPGQLTAVLAITNQGDSETTVQIRAFAWSQTAPNGNPLLTVTDELRTSPALTIIAPAGVQVVRIVLRRPPQQGESTYRIVLDQIPPPARPGVVQIALRVSIPVFAEPATRLVSHLRYRVEREAGEAYFVASNDGGRHEALRDIVLKTRAGRELRTELNLSPYVLAGSTRRWRIVNQADISAPGQTLHLTAHADTGAVEQPVPITASP